MASFLFFFFFFNDTATTEIYTLSLHDALPICIAITSTRRMRRCLCPCAPTAARTTPTCAASISMDGRSRPPRLSRCASFRGTFLFDRGARAVPRSAGGGPGMLKPGELHIWRVRLNRGKASPPTPEEAGRAARLATPALRRRYLGAHAALRAIL